MHGLDQNFPRSTINAVSSTAFKSPRRLQVFRKPSDLFFCSSTPRSGHLIRHAPLCPGSNSPFAVDEPCVVAPERSDTVRDFRELR